MAPPPPYDLPNTPQEERWHSSEGTGIESKTERPAAVHEHRDSFEEDDGEDEEPHSNMLDQLEENANSESLAFCAFIGLSVFLHVQLVALETDYGCQDFNCSVDRRLPWFCLDVLFTILFIVDVLATMKFTGLKTYFRGEPLLDKYGFSIFNCFDLCVVIVRAVGVALEFVGIYTGLKYVSLVRAVHITRFVRRMRLVSAFRELWLVVAGVTDTIRVVAWVAVLLVVLLWTFATVVTLAVGGSDAKQFDFSRSSWTKDEYWGSVPRSMYSLFQVFTGDEWSSSLTGPLIKKHPALVIIFLIFRLSTILALMNTIVGVLVETTLSSARATEEARSRDKQRKDAMVMESLREIFRQADTDQSGKLDPEELAAMMRTPSVRDRMRMLEIPVKQLQLLHTLLDVDGCGEVETNAFFRGCSRLRGPAMAVDLHQMSIDLDRHLHLVDNHIQNAGAANDALSDLLDCMEEVDIDVVQGEADKKDPVLIARRGRPRQPKANILRNRNWVDNSPPAFLMNPDAATTPRVSSISRKSLVRATLRGTAGSGLDATSRSGPVTQPGLYMQPEVPPPPPPLPGDVRSASLETTSTPGARPILKTTPARKDFLWPS